MESRKLIETFPNNNIALNWCIDNGFIPSQKLCRNHHTPMNIESDHGKFDRFICTKGSCKSTNKVSRVSDTWFDNVKIEIPAAFR